MGGFDNDRQNDTPAVQQAPDFTTAIASYNKMVTDIGLKIKAANSELEGVLAELSEAKAALQAQYDKRVDELGGQIAVLEAHIEDLKGKVASLDTQVAERQATKEAIQLDFEEERKTLALEWVALHKSSAEIADAEKHNLEEAEDIAATHNLIIEEAKQFEVSQAAELSELTKQRTEVAEQKAAIDIKVSEVSSLLFQANTKLNAIAVESAALDAKIAEAKVVIAQADEVVAQKNQNAAQLAINSDQAFRNDKDIQEIKVARVALNNLKQQLDARQQMLTLAEQKVGG